MRWRCGECAPGRMLAGVLFVFAGLGAGAVSAGAVNDAAGPSGNATPSNREFIHDAADRAVSRALDGLPLSSGDSVAVQGRQEDAARIFWEEIITEALTHRGLLVYRLAAAAEPGAPAMTPVSGTPGAQGGPRTRGGRGAGGAGETQISGPTATGQEELATMAREAAATKAAADSASAADSAAADSSAAEDHPAGVPGGPPPVPAMDPFKGPYVRFSSQELALAYTRAHGGALFGHPTLDRHAHVSVLVELASGHDAAVNWTGRGEATATDRVRASRLGEIELSPLPCAPPKWEGRSLTSRLAEPGLVVSIVGGLVYLFYANRTN